MDPPCRAPWLLSRAVEPSYSVPLASARTTRALLKNGPLMVMGSPPASRAIWLTLPSAEVSRAEKTFDRVVENMDLRLRTTEREITDKVRTDADSLGEACRAVSDALRDTDLDRGWCTEALDALNAQFVRGLPTAAQAADNVIQVYEVADLTGQRRLDDLAHDIDPLRPEVHYFQGLVFRKLGERRHGG